MNKMTAITLLCLCVANAGLYAEDWTVVGAGHLDLQVLKGEGTLFEIKNYLHGFGWNHTRYQGLTEVRDGARTYEQMIGFFERGAQKPMDLGQIDLQYEVRKTGPKTIRITYNCTPTKPITFHQPKKSTDAVATGGPQIEPSPYFRDGQCIVKTEDGKTQEFAMPPPRGSTDRVKEITCKTADGEATKITFDPPIFFHRDQAQARFWMSSGKEIPAGQLYKQTITMEFPEKINFEPDNRWVDTSDWIELNIENDFTSPSPISLADWQDRPAGKHGFAIQQGDRYVFEDGTPVKLWGVNLINVNVDRPLFDQWALSLSKYGFNLGRMVAFAKPNWPNKWAHYIKLQDVNDSLKFDKDNLDLFDYGFAKLKEHGIYVGFSPFYGCYPTPADKDRLIAYDELTEVLAGFPANGSYYAATWMAKDVQDLQIQFHINLLNHKNPYTGLRYADDPALVFVELQNEENTYLQLWQLDRYLNKCPTYKKLYYEAFVQWLKNKYGTLEAVKTAWGGELKPNETFEAANIDPTPAWFAGNTKSKRTADQMAYIYHTQHDYYQRFVKAVRKTGYKGGLSGSCWQAANWIGHLHNILTDYEVGQIDRHNYATCDFKNPGAGLMSAGFQAVIDRPFSYSEWHGGYRVGMKTDIPVVAAYGMGLHGWDLSMQFAWAHAGALPYEHTGINNVINGFGTLGQHPFMARMVRRMDIEEGDVVGNRRISLQALNEKADVGFEETFSLLGGANNKRFNAAVPQPALAAGRVVLEYVDGPVEEPVIDRSAQYIDEANKIVRSTTGQLEWHYEGEGYYTVNTPGTQAGIGFIGRRELDLDNVTIQSDTPYAHIMVTATEKDRTIEQSKQLLILAMARSVDKGTKFDELGERPLVSVPAKKGPLMLEPVRAEITLKGVKKAKVYALDHDGRKPEGAEPLPVKKTRDGIGFRIDGAATKAVYYVVER